jgi:hypothetical protein
MVSKHRPRSGTAESALREGRYPIDTGICELERIDDGWLVLVNGFPSSHVDPADPARLDFPYMRWIAAVVAARWGTGDQLRALHLGGGACSLPRHIAAVYPQARQVVVEIDGALAALVREWFWLPRAPLVRLRVGEARAVTESLADASRHLVVRDVFAKDETPLALTTADFVAHVRRVLAPGGTYILNCGVSRDLGAARREAATLLGAFAEVALIADAATLSGKRPGNVVLAGSGSALGLERAPALSAGPAHPRVWLTDQVRRFAAGARVPRDSDFTLG